MVERPSRARVFERLGIDYCCGGQKPLDQACDEIGIDVQKVLKELLAEQSVQVQPERYWATASLTDLADHIEQTHHNYLREELPRLEFLTGKVANRHGERLPYLLELHEVFRAMYDSLAQLEKDMHQHVHKENNILFPKALRAERLLAQRV